MNELQLTVLDKVGEQKTKGTKLTFPEQKKKRQKVHTILFILPNTVKQCGLGTHTQTVKVKRKEISTTEIMAPSAVRRGTRTEGASGVLVKF